MCNFDQKSVTNLATFSLRCLYIVNYVSNFIHTHCNCIKQRRRRHLYLKGAGGLDDSIGWPTIAVSTKDHKQNMCIYKQTKNRSLP